MARRGSLETAAWGGIRVITTKDLFFGDWLGRMDHLSENGSGGATFWLARERNIGI